MPNHVKNLLEIKTDPQTLKIILDNIKSKELIFDFNKVIKMPKSLDIESSTLTDFFWSEKIYVPEAVDQLRDQFNCKNLTKKDLKNVAKSLQNIVLYGYPSWYKWSTKNWGTKWNAYAQKMVRETTIEFDTAWNPPIPVLIKLSQKYPSSKFSLTYADEDTGCNCGYLEFLGGNQVVEKIPTSLSKEAYELSFRIRPEDKDWYYFDEAENTYLYKEVE